MKKSTCQREEKNCGWDNSFTVCHRCFDEKGTYHFLVNKILDGVIVVDTTPPKAFPPIDPDLNPPFSKVYR